MHVLPPRPFLKKRFHPPLGSVMSCAVVLIVLDPDFRTDVGYPG